MQLSPTTWFEEPVRKDLIIIYGNTDLLGVTIFPDAVQAVVSTRKKLLLLKSLLTSMCQTLIQKSA